MFLLSVCLAVIAFTFSCLVLYTLNRIFMPSISATICLEWYPPIVQAAELLNLQRPILPPRRTPGRLSRGLRMAAGPTAHRFETRCPIIAATLCPTSPCMKLASPLQRLVPKPSHRLFAVEMKPFPRISYNRYVTRTEMSNTCLLTELDYFCFLPGNDEAVYYRHRQYVEPSANYNDNRFPEAPIND